MYLGYWLCAVIAVSGLDVLASSLVAIPAPGVQIQLPPIATISPSAESFVLEREAIELDERQNGQPAQKPLMGCPEMFNDPILHCSSCGGESDTSPGTCKDPNVSGWVCKCTNQGPNGLTTSLVTVTASGQTATGTYELDTLTEYASLREHITITTTVTATTTSDSGVETIAAVVLAGGVAWFLADVSGGAAAISALQSPETAQDHDDDKTCPNPQHNCNDCSGKDQMCTTGADSGCACEEKDECPADNSEDQPECTDDACTGSDGKCTTGDHEGCNCKKPECPDITKFTFFCSDCGGAGSDGKCKGDPEDDNNWVGCDCSQDPDWDSQTPGLKRPNAHNHQQALAALPDITYPSTPTQTSTPQTQCDMNDISKVPWNVFSPGVYTGFCKTLNSGDKTKSFSQIMDSGGNVVPATASKSKKRGDIFRRTPPANPDTYKGYTFALSWSGGDGSCASDCSTIFSTMANSPCGHTAGDQNIMAGEAKLDTGCGIYSYKISPPPATTATPSRPETAFTCSDHTVYTAFTLKQAQDSISKFCASDITLPLAAQPVSNTYDIDNVRLQLSTQWSQSGQDGCATTNPINQLLTKEDCTTYFLSAVNDCDTDTQTKKYGSKPFTWSGPNGCIDFNIYGDGTNGIS